MLAGMATNVAVFGLGIILSIVLTRSLGADGRGVYVLLATTGSVLANVLNASVGVACSTLLARGRYSLGTVHTVAVLVALVAGGLGLAVVSFAFPVLQPDIFSGVPYGYLLVALLLVPLLIYQLYWNAMMVGLNRVVLMNQVSLAQNLGNTLLMIAIVGIAQGGIPGFLLAWATSTAVATVAMFVIALRVERPAWPPRRAVLAEMLGFGLRGHGTSIAHHLFLDFDTYAVKVLVGTAGLGYYSLSVSLAEKLWVPVSAFGSAAMARIAQLPRAESALLTAKVTRTALLLMFAAALPFGLLSPWLIPFLYGDAFAVSVLPLIILLLGTPAFAAMLVLNTYIVSRMERPGLLSIISWIELGVSIPLYIGLIAWQGILGGALASTLTYWIAAACTLAIFARDSGLPVGQVLLPRAADFRDYGRVLRAVLQRVPGLRRFAHDLS